MAEGKKGVAIHEVVGDEYGNARPIGKPKGVEIPNELHRDVENEKDER